LWVRKEVDMRHFQRASLLCVVLLGLETIGAQISARPVGQDLQVELSTAVKAKKAKVGDTVTAVIVAPVKLSSGLVIPAGSKVVGHVRKAEADSGDAHTSFIALSFEEIDLKKGQTVPLHCFIRAALMPTLKGVMGQELEHGQTAAPMSMDAPARAASGPGSGAGSSMVDVNNPISHTSVEPQGDTKPVAARVHTGQVVGIRGVELQVTGPDYLSTFQSTHKNLELDQGLQLMLVVMQ